MNALVIFSLSTSYIQAFSAYLYNNSGEPLSISYTSIDNQNTLTTKTLDKHGDGKMLLIETSNTITINKANNQSITISNQGNQNTYKTFTISGNDLNGASYSYNVLCSLSIEKPYLCIDGDDPKYGYKIYTKKSGANT